MNIEYEQFKKKTLFPYKNSETSKQTQQRRVEQTQKISETRSTPQFNVREKNYRSEIHFPSQEEKSLLNSERNDERETLDLIKLDSWTYFTL